MENRYTALNGHEYCRNDSYSGTPTHSQKCACIAARKIQRLATRIARLEDSLRRLAIKMTEYQHMIDAAESHEIKATLRDNLALLKDRAQDTEDELSPLIRRWDRHLDRIDLDDDYAESIEHGFTLIQES